MTSSILVTGGTGTLGRLVVKHLRDAGSDVRVLTRHTRDSEPGLQFITGDLLTGAGVDEAVQGVEAIVHCAGNFKGDAAMTRTLVAGGAQSRRTAPRVHLRRRHRSHPCRRRRPSHICVLSRQARGRGRDRSSGLPWTTLRATQFYDLFLIVGKAVAKLPVAPFAAGFRFQPVEADEVAARLVALAHGAACRAGARPRRPARLPHVGSRPQLPARCPSPPAAPAPLDSGQDRHAWSAPAATSWLRRRQPSRRESGRGRSSSLARTG